MKYSLKILYAIKKNQPVFLCLIIISVLMSSIMIHFSYGTYRIFREKKLSEMEELRHLDIGIKRDAGLTKASLDNCFLQFPEDLEHLVEMVLVHVKIEDGLTLESRFAMKGGSYAPAANFGDNLRKANMTDRYFTPEQEVGGELVALAGTAQENGGDGFLTLQNKKYRIIGRQSWVDTAPLVPFGSLDGGTQVAADGGIYLSFSKAITKRQYEDLKRQFIKNLGDLVYVPPLSGKIGQDRPVYNSVIVISACIAAVAAINHGILFQYIMLRQRRMLAVFRICGMRQRKAVWIYLLECLFLITPVYIVGAVLFHLFVLPVLEEVSVSIRPELTPLIYLMLFAGYMATSAGILALVIAVNIYKRPITELVRRT